MTARILDSSKRLEEWVTRLKTDSPFAVIRIKLAIAYALNSIVLLAASYVSLNYGGGSGPVLGIHPQLFDVGLLVVLSASLLTLLTQTALKPIHDNMEAQKRFIASASHELRTPLSIIKANSEVALLDEKNLTADEAISIFKENVEEINRMADVISVLLQLDSVEVNSGNMQLYAKLDLADIVKRALKDVRNSAISKNISLHESIEVEAHIWGNETSLRAMALNIVNNAIAYTPVGGDVYIDLKYDNGYKNIEFKVTDTGVGIPKEDLPYIFHPFYRTSVAKRVRQSGHFGLGLSLVYKIVKDHGGRISVLSPEEKGAEVTIHLPASLKEYLHTEPKRPGVSAEKL